MKLFKTNKLEFKKFLEGVFLNGTIKDVSLEVTQKGVYAKGGDASNSLYFDVLFIPTELYNQGKIIIKNLPEFIKVVERADADFNFILKDNEIVLHNEKTFFHPVDNDECISYSYQEDKDLNKEKLIFTIKDFITKKEEKIKFSNKHDISTLDFAQILADFKAVGSKDMSPRFIFMETKLLIENIMTGSKVLIPLKNKFEKDVMFSSGIIQNIFKLKPAKLEVYLSSADNIYLLVIDDNNYYVVQGSDEVLGNADEIPF